MQNAKSKLTAPPTNSYFHLYAAGAPGDHRPQGERLADRVIEEGLQALTGPCDTHGKTYLSVDYRQLLRRALERAFRAGRAFQHDHPEELL